jgi:hypothetical protein
VLTISSYFIGDIICPTLLLQHDIFSNIKDSNYSGNFETFGNTILIDSKGYCIYPQVHFSAETFFIVKKLVVLTICRLQFQIQNTKISCICLTLILRTWPYIFLECYVLQFWYFLSVSQFLRFSVWKHSIRAITSL